LAAGAAVSYGITVVLNRSMATAQLPAGVVLSLRFGVAALVVFVVLAVLRRPLWPAAGERWRVFLVGLVGYGLESMIFFAALERGTAAAVSLLFYSYPTVVTLLERALDRRRLLAVALSTGGTVLVIVAGAEVSISVTGAVLAVAAAVAFALYLLAGHRLIRHTDALVTSAWVAGGAALWHLTRAVLNGRVSPPLGHWPQLLGNGLATAAAFVLMFAALRRIGAGPTSVVMTLEALSAVVLGGLFLNETLRPLQAVGGAAILFATTRLPTSR
jgi:drug/metabolite transporter (DMT)-like permease